MILNKYSILLLLIITLGCKKPFSETSKTALALPKVMLKTTESIVFIAGYDEGDNTYYSNAKHYFEAQKTLVIDHLFSVAEIITWLNQNPNKTYKNIHIVSHSNAWLGMALKTIKNGERITVKTLSLAKNNNKIPVLKYGITTNTNVIFHSCGLGDNKALLQNIKPLFITKHTPKIVASSYFNIFGGKFAGHYLAKPYYGYYPTAESPGPAALSKTFKTNYPDSPINWFTALKTRQETTLGEVYSYKFNIPVEWEFTFDNETEIPKLSNKEAIMDWVSESQEMAETLYNLNIPIEKYRWKSQIKGNKLYIKGKTTVLCVLEPILHANDDSEYRTATIDDTSLYHTM
ncbi:hypothetical protein [uncultured Algibacter sp.]|uniref:hypothetical protein n=1 Tax=uncultured Algibacter sp. TaxID=298659 RepID=UPI003216902E